MYVLIVVEHRVIDWELGHSSWNSVIKECSRDLLGNYKGLHCCIIHFIQSTSTRLPPLFISLNFRLISPSLVRVNLVNGYKYNIVW
jgi:hypothetical protein